MIDELLHIRSLMQRKSVAYVIKELKKLDCRPWSIYLEYCMGLEHIEGEIQEIE